MRVESPALSIVPDGRIMVNAAAVRILITTGIKSVLLLWDRANLKIAVKAAQKADQNAYAVTVVPGGHSGSIRARGFISHIGWKATRRQMLPAVWNERDRMFEVSLPAQHLRSEAVEIPGTENKPRL